MVFYRGDYAHIPRFRMLAQTSVKGWLSYPNVPNLEAQLTH